MPWFRQEPLSLEQRRRLIESWQHLAEDRGDEHFGVFDPQYGIVGAVGLHPHPAAGGAEIGYWTHVEHVRRGVASAAALAMTDYAFSRPQTVFVEIHHDEANCVSGRIPRKLGYTRCGTFDAPRLAPGNTGRECIWRLTRSDWELLRRTQSHQ